MHTSPRPGGVAAIHKLVLHLNVGPEVEGGARSLLRYLQGVSAGYHEIGDDKESVIGAPPDQIVEGASGMNTDGYHYCVIANLQDRAGWTDVYSSAELLIAARRFAELCHQFGIPPVHLTDSQIADRTTKGICDHFGVNRAIVKPAVARGDKSMGPGDHTDVGADFPWDIFMPHVVAFYGGGPMPTPTPQPVPVHQEDDNNMSIICTRVNSTVPGREPFVDFDPDSKTLFAFNGPTFATGADPKTWQVTAWPKNDKGITGTAKLLLATTGKLKYAELPAKNGVAITADGDGGTFGIGYHQLDS